MSRFLLAFVTLLPAAAAFAPLGARPMAAAVAPRVAVQPAMQFGKREKKSPEEVLEEKGCARKPPRKKTLWPPASRARERACVFAHVFFTIVRAQFLAGRVGLRRLRLHLRAWHRACV